MHERLISEGFNRRFVLLPLLLSIALVLCGYWVTESRRAQTRQLNVQVQARHAVIGLMGESIVSALQAENAQRRFLITADARHLPQMESGLGDAQTRLDELIAVYRGLDPAALPVLERAKAGLSDQMQQMRRDIGLRQDGQPAAAALAQAELTVLDMQSVLQGLQDLRRSEEEKVQAELAQWRATVHANSTIGFASMLFTIAVLVVLGLLVSRDIRRRESYASALTAQIEARTAELRDLGRHMGRVAEAEKYALARELHDELGGLLVAMRMDLAQIRKRLAATSNPELQPHWDRVEQALGAGLELKRRVIEELRPTLLDNMGLFTALRWLASQRAEQAQLKLTTFGLDEDIELPPDTGIAVFRSVQEAISNVVKHSGASQLTVTAEVDDDELVVRVADDGHGVPVDAEQRAGAHGLKQMRFRMESVGGTLRVSQRQPAGTLVELAVPLGATAAAA